MAGSLQTRHRDGGALGERRRRAVVADRDAQHGHRALGRVVHRLEEADLAFCHSGGLGWDATEALAPMGARAHVAGDIATLRTLLGERDIGDDFESRLGELLTGLAADSDVLQNLQERSGLVGRLRELQLDDLITDAHAPPSAPSITSRASPPVSGLPLTSIGTPLP